jgi:hypothetical protein
MNNRYIFWFGAGVSIPSGMPSGWDLTNEWLNFYLTSEDYTYIRNIYNRQNDIIGKDLPRLEKIIGDSIDIYGIRCLSVLNFMKEIIPNSMHYTIANYLVSNKTYAFTTNFDMGVEKTGRPIKTNSITSLNGWGLIKLHGCIQENHSNLGVTIKKLQNGLNEQYRSILYKLLMQENNTFVFLGYSASDYFDILPFYQSFAIKKQFFNARVVWIHHIPKLDYTTDITKTYKDELKWEIKEIIDSFNENSRTVIKGNSELALANLIPTFYSKDNINVKPSWKKHWNKLINPSYEQKKKLAIKFYSSIGHGKKCLELIDIPAKFNNYNEDIQIYLNTLRDCGYYQSEFYIRNKLNKNRSIYSKTYFDRLYCSSLRLSDRNIRAFIMYTFYLLKYMNYEYYKQNEDDHNSAMCIIAESALFYQSILHRAIPRSLIIVLLTLPIEHIIRNLMALSVKLYKKYTNYNNSGNEPGLKALMHRINDFLSIPIFQLPHWGGLLNKIDFLNKNGFDITDFTDMTYIQIDSLLGVTNYNRNRAYNNIRNLQLGLLKPLKNKFNQRMYYEISDALEISLTTSKCIKDIPGQIKAYRLLSLLSFYENNYSKSRLNIKKSKLLRKKLSMQDNKYKKHLKSLAANMF